MEYQHIQRLAWITFGSRANVLVFLFCLTFAYHCTTINHGQLRPTAINHGQLRSTAIDHDRPLSISRSISRFSWQDDAVSTWYNTSARMNLLPNASWWNASGRAYPDVAALATPYQTVCDGFVQTGMIYKEKSFVLNSTFSYFWGGVLYFSQNHFLTIILTHFNC